MNLWLYSSPHVQVISLWQRIFEVAAKSFQRPIGDPNDRRREIFVEGIDVQLHAVVDVVSRHTLLMWKVSLRQKWHSGPGSVWSSMTLILILALYSACARESTIQRKAIIWNLAFSVELWTVEHWPNYWWHLLTSQSKPGFKSAKSHWPIPSYSCFTTTSLRKITASVEAEACLPALYDWECKGYHCMWFRQEENLHFLWLRVCPFYCT